MRPHAAPLFLLAALAASIVLAACSLADDVTPVPGSAPLPGPQPVIDLGPGFPAARPSAVNGARIFAERCAACHGPAGQGDGELAGQLQVPPSDFTDPAVARNAAPAAWQAIVTRGNLERFMPPFGGSLSEAERWDVVAHLFTLGAPPDALAEGQAIYEAGCAACHGPAGRGDGPEAPAAAPPDLADQERMAGLSQADLFDRITSAHDPGAGEALSEAERWAAAFYVRSFSMAFSAPEDPAALRGTVAGRVINETWGAPAADGLTVVLYGFDDFRLATTMTETVNAEGAFLFEAVPFQPGRAFVVTTDYAGVSYGSDVAELEGEAGRLDLPLSVYEATSDASGLRIERMHIFFDFSPGRATVAELILLSNPGRETVLGGPALQFALPPGAADLRVDGLTPSADYVQTEAGFSLNQPIPPGVNATQLLVSFFLPYERGLDFAQTVPFALGAANVIVPDAGVRLASEQLADRGLQEIEGQRFRTYNTGALPAGAVLSFRLSGRAAVGAPPVTVEAAGLIAGGGTLALVIAGLGWWYHSRGRGASGSNAGPVGSGAPTDRESLLRAIAALDDDHEAGRVGADAYRRRRAALKARLAEQWGRLPHD